METARFVHRFKIAVMEEKNCMDPVCITSLCKQTVIVCHVYKVCVVGRHIWKIEFHEKMTDPRHSYSGGDWILSRVRLIRNGAGEVAALFSCRLVDPRSLADSLEKTTSSMFYENKSQDVFLIRRSELWERSRRYLKDGCIIVQCAITVMPAYASPSIPSSDLHKQFGELLLSQVGSDITFVISGECIAAHRCVLAARSHRFSWPSSLGT